MTITKAPVRERYHEGDGDGGSVSVISCCIKTAQTQRLDTTTTLYYLSQYGGLIGFTWAVAMCVSWGQVVCELG